MGDETVDADSIAGKIKTAAREGAREGAKEGLKEAFEEFKKGLEASGFKLDDLSGSFTKLFLGALEGA